MVATEFEEFEGSEEFKEFKEFEADLSDSGGSCGSAVVDNASKQAIMIWSSDIIVAGSRGCSKDKSTVTIGRGLQILRTLNAGLGN